METTLQGKYHNYQIVNPGAILGSTTCRMI